jgi:hypothetical protein
MVPTVIGDAILRDLIVDETHQGPGPVIAIAAAAVLGLIPWAVLIWGLWTLGKWLLEACLNNTFTGTNLS